MRVSFLLNFFDQLKRRVRRRMVEVWSAFDSRLNREVASRVLPNVFSPITTAWLRRCTAMFIPVLAKLSNPNVTGGMANRNLGACEDLRPTFHLCVIRSLTGKKVSSEPMFLKTRVPLLLLASCSPVPAVDSRRIVPIRVDNHVHLNSPAIQSFLPEFCESMRRFGGCDPALSTPHSAEDLLAAMARAGIRRALVVSNGYLAESPMMEPQRADAVDLMRAANDWTVKLARRYPRQLAAFIAVDPIRPTALPEIARWRGNPAVSGIKLHLTGSAVDLRRDGDVAALAAVFRAAADARLAIVIHLRTQQMDYGASDIRRFVEDVLPAAGNTPVQIAHAGGWGGIDAATLSALGAFADAVEKAPPRFHHVWFDLAGVWTDKSPAADKQALVALIRRIGLRHFLPASDWPYNGDNLADYYDRVYSELPLTQREWAIIRSNVAPYAR